jgi:hypothetical protein
MDDNNKGWQPPMTKLGLRYTQGWLQWIDLLGSVLETVEFLSNESGPKQVSRSQSSLKGQSYQYVLSQ